MQDNIQVVKADLEIPEIERVYGIDPTRPDKVIFTVNERMSAARLAEINHKLHEFFSSPDKKFLLIRGDTFIIKRVLVEEDERRAILIPPNGVAAGDLQRGVVVSIYLTGFVIAMLCYEFRGWGLWGIAGINFAGWLAIYFELYLWRRWVRRESRENPV